MLHEKHVLQVAILYLAVLSLRDILLHATAQDGLQRLLLQRVYRSGEHLARSLNDVHRATQSRAVRSAEEHIAGGLVRQVAVGLIRLAYAQVVRETRNAQLLQLGILRLQIHIIHIAVEVDKRLAVRHRTLVHGRLAVLLLHCGQVHTHEFAGYVSAHADRERVVARRIVNNYAAFQRRIRLLAERNAVRCERCLLQHAVLLRRRARLHRTRRAAAKRQ